MAEAAKRALGVDSFQIVADAGYSNGEQAAQCEAAGMLPHVPVMRTVNNQGDGTLFAREDYAEEAWRIVDPVLNAATPVYEYEPNTWGPREAERITPEGGWQNPKP